MTDTEFLAPRKAVAFGTVSAPVSRQTSRTGQDPTAGTDASPEMVNQVIANYQGSHPSSSDDATTLDGSAHPHVGPGSGMSIAMPPKTGDLQSISAPASPHPVAGDGMPALGSSAAVNPLESSTLMAPLAHSQTADASLDGGASTLAPSRLSASVDPAIGGDELSGAARRHHHHHRHGGSGRSSRASDPYFTGHGGYLYGPYSRPMDHQTSNHKTPLYSLARPLPTQQQRDFQRSYRNEVRQRAAEIAASGGRKHHHAHAARAGGSIGGSDLSRVSTRDRHAVLGPGAVHHGGVPGGNPYYPSPFISRSATPAISGENAQLMAMMKQLLRQTQGNGTKGGEIVPASQSDDGDIREDGALGRKADADGGINYSDESKAKQRTKRAERRDTLASDASSVSSGSSCSSSEGEEDEGEQFPNPWARVRHSMREVFAEYIGTMLLILFGTGVSLQTFLSMDPNVASSPRGQYLSISFGWGIGVAMGVWVAGGISGGHINPAVTLCLAVFRGFPWKKVPGYVLAQILGSMTAAGINYGLYRHAISIYEGGRRTVTGTTATASLFATYPLDYVSDANAFFQEFTDSAVLLIVVLAISDSNNASPPDGLNPLVLFLLITGIGAALGMQTAYCINPARDLGPRLVTWFAGYGRGVWTFRNEYFIWTPILATISGAMFGSLIYDTLIYTGSESPCNMRWEFPWRNKKREPFAPASKQKLPAGQSEP